MKCQSYLSSEKQLGPVGTGAFVTSMVALDNGIPQELEASVSFFGYFFADQKSNKDLVLWKRTHFVANFT